jgi:hypothetical protein
VTGRPFTAAVCQAGPCRARGLDLLPRLATVVRTCPHGILLRTGCLLQAARCRPGAAHDSGGFLLVQPCDRERRPRGTVIVVGPVLTAADAEAVARWLSDGNLDARQLHPRLRGPGRLTPNDVTGVPWPSRISDERG